MNPPYLKTVLLDILGLISSLVFFVPIFRGEILIGVLHLIFSLVTFGLFQLIMPFLYNKQYSTRMLNESWSLNDSEENNALARQKIGIAID